MTLQRLTYRAARVLLRRRLLHHGGRCFSSQVVAEAEADAQYSDVLIVGGGVVGCALARQLNQRLPTLSVHLMEARDSPLANASSPPESTIPHPRSYALSPRSLEVLGLLDNNNNKTTEEEEEEEEVKLGWYDTMQIWESRNPATVRFNTTDLPFDESKIDQPKMLGAVVEDIPLVRSLWRQLENHSQTTLSTNTTLKDLHYYNTTSSNNGHGLVTVESSRGTFHKSRLLVAADGASSPIRQKLGIQQMQYDYGRQALTFTVELATDDRVPRTAYQRFIHNNGDDDNVGMGPLALLPTHSPRHAIVVWSTTPDVVKKWKETDDSNNDALIDHLNLLLQQGPQRLPPLVEPPSPGHDGVPPLLSNVLFGVERVLETVQDAGAMAAATNNRSWMAPPKLSKIVSPKLSFPLSCRNVPHYTTSGNRIVLVGDAAHTVHPMAGQGLNLGLGSVSSLVEAIVETESVGMDITMSLEKYLQKQHPINTSVILGIHALHEIFAIQPTQNVPMMHAKSFGMNIVQQIGPLRRKVVQAATQGILF